MVQPLEIGFGLQRRELVDLVHHEVPGLPIRRYPPAAAEESRNGEPLGQMLVRMPIVVLGNGVPGDVERQEHGGFPSSGSMSMFHGCDVRGVSRCSRFDTSCRQGVARSTCRAPAQDRSTASHYPAAGHFERRCCRALPRRRAPSRGGALARDFRLGRHGPGSSSDSCHPRWQASTGIASGMPSCTMSRSVPQKTFFSDTVTVSVPGKRIVEPVRVADALVRHQLQVLATERVTGARREIRKRHPVGAADLRIQMVDLAGEAVRREPLDHRVGVQERAIDALRRRSQHSVKSDGAGSHGVGPFRRPDDPDTDAGGNGATPSRARPARGRSSRPEHPSDKPDLAFFETASRVRGLLREMVDENA